MRIEIFYPRELRENDNFIVYIFIFINIYIYAYP